MPLKRKGLEVSSGVGDGLRGGVHVVKRCTWEWNE